MDDLRDVSRKGLQIDKLYKEIASIRTGSTRVIKKVEKNREIRVRKKKKIENKCIERFIAGLKGQLQLRVKNKDPETLREAHEVAKQLGDTFLRDKNMTMEYEF